MKPLCSTLDEQCFIGCVVSSQGEALDSFPLEVEAFFDNNCRTIFTAILAIYKEGGKIGSDTVISRIGHEAASRIGIGEIEALCFYPSPSMTSQFHKVLCEKLALRKARLMASTVLHALENDEPEPMDFCRDLAIQAASLMPETTCENQLFVACDELDKRLTMMESGTKEYGFKTPLEAWNGAFGGICNGHLYALASRPGMGKTALMEQIVCGYLMDDHAVLVFEKDMSPRILIERMACRVAKVPYWKLVKGLVTREEVAEIRRMNAALKQTKLLLYNPTGLTAEKMSAITRREKRVSGISAVFLDHIQVLNTGTKDPREGLTKASICVRQTTTETDIPHIVLAHINRNGAKGRPTPEDIKEFDQLYGDCDGMAMLWTEADKTKLEHGEFLKMNMYFAKNRNGPVAEEPVLFDGAMMAFRNASKI